MGQTFYQTNFCFLFCPYTVYNTFFQSYITLQINRRKKFLLLKQNPKSTKFNLCITNNYLTMQCWYIVWLTYVEIFLTIFFIVTWSLFISFVFVKASFLLDRIFWEERNYFSCNPNRFFFLLRNSRHGFNLSTRDKNLIGWEKKQCRNTREILCLMENFTWNILFDMLSHNMVYFKHKQN